MERIGDAMYEPTELTPCAIRPEESSFEGQVLLQAQFLRFYARYLCRDRLAAEDLVQDVILKALQHRDQFEPGTNLKAWLRAIMRNTHVLRNRRRWREVDYDPEGAERKLVSWADPSIPMELDDVRRALCLMPPRYRDPLVLAAGGSSYDEMSCILGCAIGTVKSRLSRARDLLQAVLREGEFKALPCSSDPLAKLEADYASLAAERSGAPDLMPVH
jgi:RNA polymerase sigma-70 factor (ECF subfamily)